MATEDKEIEAAMARVMRESIVLTKALDQLAQRAKMPVADVAILLRMVRNHKVQRMGPTLRSQVELLEAKLDLVTLGDSPYEIAKRKGSTILKPDGITNWNLS